MKNIKGKIRVHLWIESDRGMIFGLGRSQLIDNIEKCGSLQKAAEKMGISYRAAWGRIKKTEEVLGKKLLTRTSSGNQLSEFGKEINDLYRQWFKKVEDYALKEAEKIFPWDSTFYSNNVE